MTTPGATTSSSMATRVGIAVVVNDGSVLVGRRKADQVLAGHDEFPGGKCQQGESPQNAAVRECLEETGLSVRATQLLEQLTHNYDHGKIEIHFWFCKLDNGDTEQDLKADFGWIPINELSTLSFPEANRSVVARLIENVN